jgi:DNA-binding CsgD family transcriptional regulator
MDAVILKKNTVVISQKEIIIVQMLADGNRTADIAKKLKLSVRTIEANLDSLRNKFDAKTLPQLVAIFLKNQFIK